VLLLNRLRSIACGAALALGSCGEAGDRAAADPPPGEAFALGMEANLKGLPGPALSFTTLAGDVVDLEQSYGRKPIYLKIWATWCAPCRAQMPHLESTYARIKDDFVVLAVATGINETEADVRALVMELGLETPVAVDDGGLAAAVGLRVTPVHVVIGRDGRILHVGQLADERLEAALAEARRRPARSAAEGSAPAEVEVLSRLPELTLTTVDGEAITLAPTDGSEPTALVFLLPWCEDYLAASQPEAGSRCREVREEVERRQAQGGARWIGVASGLWDQEADVVRYRDANAVTLPLVLDADGTLFRSFGVRSTPVILVFGPGGEQVARIDEASGLAELQTALDAALAGRSGR
jgi:thiol-disulfide isomerase/thioredoxin